MIFDDGSLTLGAGRARDVDAYISADPAALMLVFIGRQGLGKPLLGGTLAAWGRRPWKLARMLTVINPRSLFDIAGSFSTFAARLRRDEQSARADAGRERRLLHPPSVAAVCRIVVVRDTPAQDDPAPPSTCACRASAEEAQAHR
ncbi:hypothetical protein GCM10022403_085440 [Streptomyces coacervatus]|uniref:Uncharacterized protein n=2 Tax=Streptomyces coacervatus TaxID=647381 RepID=A0ABP7JB30_9ACTN